MARYQFDAPEWPDEFLFLGEGSATYPEGELEYMWEGIGSAGAVVSVPSYKKRDSDAAKEGVSRVAGLA